MIQVINVKTDTVLYHCLSKMIQLINKANDSVNRDTALYHSCTL